MVEQVLSPLKGTTTAADLGAVSTHEGAFALSVLVGILASVLYVPAFLGLARSCLERSPRLAHIGAALAVLSMLGFMGVRGIQAIELQVVGNGLPLKQAADLIDGASSNPVGITILVLFLGGSALGGILLGIATWRSGFPRPAAVLFLLFGFLDLVLVGHLGTIVSHGVLLVALTWFAVHLASETTARTPARAAVAPQRDPVT